MGATHVLLSDDDSLPPHDMVFPVAGALPPRRMDSLLLWARCQRQDRRRWTRLIRIAAGTPSGNSGRAGRGPPGVVPHRLGLSHLGTQRWRRWAGWMRHCSSTTSDLEWGLRARRAGYRLHCAARVALPHSLGDETVKLPGGMTQPVTRALTDPQLLHPAQHDPLIARDVVPLALAGALRLLGGEVSVLQLAVDRPPARARDVSGRGLADGLRGRRGRLDDAEVESC